MPAGIYLTTHPKASIAWQCYGNSVANAFARTARHEPWRRPHPPHIMRSATPSDRGNFLRHRSQFMQFPASNGNISKHSPGKSHSPCNLPGLRVRRVCSARAMICALESKLLRRPSAKLRRGNDGIKFWMRGHLNSKDRGHRPSSASIGRVSCV